MQKEVKLTDGETREVTIPEYLSFTTGKKVRSKFKSRMEGSPGGGGTVSIDDPIKALDEGAEIILSDVLSDYPFGMDDLSMGSAQEILDYYKEQIWEGLGGKK